MKAMFLKEPRPIEEEPLAMVEIGAEDSVDAAQHLWKWTTICGRLCCNRAIITLGGGEGWNTLSSSGKHLTDSI